MICECFTKEKTFNLSPDFQRREGNKVFKEISHVRDRGAKGQQSLKHEENHRASEQNRRTCIYLKNRTSTLFLSENLSSHSSLDSVGTAV